MELRNFVKETLKDIVGGVQDAQNEIDGALIVPQLSESHFDNLQTGMTSYQTIDFEVSVTTVEKEGSEAKLNVVAAIIGGHVKGDSSNSFDHVAKLAFKVPVKLPIAKS